MQANPRSIDALFNSQLRYVVPMFQRLYVWKETPQWETLWEDVAEKADLQLRGIKTNPHYLGALIIEGVRPTSPREVKRFLVIDGQQRLTTLQLLLCAFRDVARTAGWVTLERPAARYLENADADVMEKPDEELLKLWPTTLNRGVYRDIITAGSRGAVEKKHPQVYLPRKRKPEERSNLVEAYLYFSRKIEAWTTPRENESATGEAKAFALLQALQQDFSVVEISLSEGDDSQEIFYSLNSQGRPLSQSDLLRSLIFMRAEKERHNRDEIFKEHWSKFETPFWSSEIKRAGRPYSRLDLGLRYFLIAKTGQAVDARRVNEEYRRWAAAEPSRYPSVKDELADFGRHGEIYKRYESTPETPLPSSDLRRVLKDMEVSTALPLIMFLELEAGLDDERLGACLASIESFIARRVFSGEENKEYNKLFVEVVRALQGLKGEAVLPALNQKLLSGGGTTRHWPTDAEIIEKAITRPIYNLIKIAPLRLILERLEIALRNKKTEGVEVAPNLQVEHVLPRKWASFWKLDGLSVPANVVESPFLAQGELAERVPAIRERNAMLHTLGNLTLLNKYLNPAASNGSFDLKLFEYKNSVLRLNRHFDAASDWDEKAIRERGKKLGETLCKIWPRPAPPVD